MEEANLDVLALGAHPDDIALCCGGTLCKMSNQGYRVGVIHLSRGELGTRGTPEQRLEEAKDAAQIMGAEVHENLQIPDGNIRRNEENRRRLIRVLRRYRPRILLINADECRHPDHCDAAQLSIGASYYAGLRKIKTRDEGERQDPWRPHHVLHYMQAIEFDPTFVVDVTDVWEERTKALHAYKSQFHNPDYEPSEDDAETFISNPEFMKWIESRARSLGYRVGATYGEAFRYRHGPIGVDDLVGVLSKEKEYR